MPKSGLSLLLYNFPNTYIVLKVPTAAQSQTSPFNIYNQLCVVHYGEISR